MVTIHNAVINMIKKYFKIIWLEERIEIVSGILVYMYMHLVENIVH